MTKVNASPRANPAGFVHSPAWPDLVRRSMHKSNSAISSLFAFPYNCFGGHVVRPSHAAPHIPMHRMIDENRQDTLLPEEVLQVRWRTNCHLRIAREDGR